MRDLDAERGRVTEAHRSQPGARNQLARELIFIPLAGPHLMLAHAGSNVSVALG